MEKGIKINVEVIAKLKESELTSVVTLACNLQIATYHFGFSPFAQNFLPTSGG